MLDKLVGRLLGRKFRENKTTGKVRYKVYLYKNNDAVVEAWFKVPRNIWAQAWATLQRLYPQAKKIKTDEFEEIAYPTDMLAKIEGGIAKELLPKVLEEERKKFKRTLNFLSMQLVEARLRLPKQGDLIAYVKFRGLWHA